MNTVVGVFASRSSAERACAELAPLGIAEHRVNLLTPHMTNRELTAIPTIEAEQPGMGKALGAAVGGAVGLAGGMGIGEVALRVWSLPGIGPILAIGFLEAPSWAPRRSHRRSHRELYGAGFARRRIARLRRRAASWPFRRDRSPRKYCAGENRPRHFRTCRRGIARPREGNVVARLARRREANTIKRPAPISRMTNAISAPASKPPCTPEIAVRPMKKRTTSSATLSRVSTKAAPSAEATIAAANT